jgi:hypothetical protein
VFFIRSGKLAHQEIIGRKADTTKLLMKIEELYYADITIPIDDRVHRMDPFEVDEIQIITSWIHRHNNSAHILYAEHKDMGQLIQEFVSVISNSHTKTIHKPGEYSQLEYIDQHYLP